MTQNERERIPLTFEDIKRTPMGTVLDLYNQERIPEPVMRQYVDAWNATPCRFTELYFCANGGVKQRERKDEPTQRVSFEDFQAWKQGG